MTGKLFNSPTENQKSSQSRSIADILALPALQRKIINYIRRNKQCTLEDLVNNFEESEQLIETDLQNLTKEGFLFIEIIEGNRYYSFEFGRKNESESSLEPVSKSLVPGKPIALIINPSGNYALSAGEVFTLRVSVINQGGQSALIYLHFDETCELIQQIAGYIEPQSVALNSGQSHELVFAIPIPTDTPMGNYKYRLEIDAPNHYPEETPISHTAQLQVRPYISDIDQASDPFFVVTPNTSSTKPFVSELGDPVTVEIQVYNRSDQVDRFRLSCTDLPADWYKITYPEGAPLPGLVVNTDGLELNPGENNTIVLTINPPSNAVAKIYSPTLRVYSENQLPMGEQEEEPQFASELVMLDLFYFKVKAFYQLEIAMNTRRGTIKQLIDVGEYELRLGNKGNTPRSLKFQIDPQNAEKYCDFVLSSEEITLNPADQIRVRLDLLPQGAWKRQFYPTVLSFAVEVVDQEEIEIPSDHFEGVLVIEGRPWWQFFLLILGFLGTIGALVFLVWFFFFRAKPLPQVTNFNPASVVYQEVNNDVIRLNWEITEGKRIKTITVNGYYKDGSPIAKPIIYDFSKGLPEPLKEQCTLKDLLMCSGIITNARKSEEYTFELTIVTKGKKSEVITAKTSPIKIDAIPIPEILQFVSTQPIYQETKTQKFDPKKPQPVQGQILLNWSVNFADQLKELTLIGKDKEGVVILPAQSIALLKIDDPDTLKEKLAKIKPETLLILQLKNPETEEQETQVCALTADKQLNCNPNLCEVKTNFQNEVLECKGFPTGIKKPGEYTFELTPIPYKELKDPLPPKLTDVIKIASLPVKILSFQIQQNGQVLPDLPKYPFYINPKNLDPKNPPMLVISWKVDGGDDIKVELTPSPGNVIKEGKIPYFINTNPGSETITLTATNLAGEQVTRSFVIETILPPEVEAGETGKPAPGAEGEMPPPPMTEAPGSVPTLEPPPVIQPPETPVNGSNGSPPAETPAETPAGSKPTTPPRPPEAPGATPPSPPDRNSPPPAELPPKIL